MRHFFQTRLHQNVLETTLPVGEQVELLGVDGSGKEFVSGTGGGGGGGAAATDIVFRPGGVASANVATTEAELQAAIDPSPPGQAINIYVDSSLGAATLAVGLTPPPAGCIRLFAFNVATVTDNTGTPPAGSDVLTVEDGAVIEWLGQVSGGLWVKFVAATVSPLTYPGATEAELTLDRCKIDPLTAGGVPLCNVTAGVLVVIMRGAVQFSGAAGVAALHAAGGIVELAAFENNTINSTTIGQTTGDAFYLYDASCGPASAFTIGTVFTIPVDSDQDMAYGTGTAFPAFNLQDGQPFYRDDLKAHYTYDLASGTWVLNTAVSTYFFGPATFDVPPGVVSMCVEVWGGGGGGGGGANGGTASETVAGGGGGGGAGNRVVTNLAVTPGDSISVVIGAGGGGGAAATAGNPGNPSLVADTTSGHSVLGFGGSGGDSGAVSGLGGQNTTGGGGAASLLAWGVGYGSQSSYSKLLAIVGVTVVGAGTGGDGATQTGDGNGGIAGTEGAPAVGNAGGGGGGGGSALFGDGGAGGNAGDGNAAGVGGPGLNGGASDGGGGGGGGGGGSGSTGGGAGGAGGGGAGGGVIITWVI